MGEPAFAIMEEAAGEEAVRQTVRLTLIAGGAVAAEAGGAVVAGEAAAGGAAAIGIGGAAVATAGIAVVVIGLVALGYYLYSRSKAGDQQPQPKVPPNPEVVTPCQPATPGMPLQPEPQAQPQLLPQPGGPGSHCDALQKQIYEAMETVRGRIDALLEDKLDLYHLAYDTPNPLLPPNSGTWLGHQTQAEGWKNRLRHLINQAISNNCPVPPGAWRLATRQLPRQPRGN